MEKSPQLILLAPAPVVALRVWLGSLPWLELVLLWSSWALQKRSTASILWQWVAGQSYQKIHESGWLGRVSIAFFFRATRWLQRQSALKENRV